MKFTLEKMADQSRDSSIKAQVPTVCEICEESTIIKFRCIQCGYFLCDWCRKFHERVKTQEAHDIVDIREREAVVKASRTQLTPCKIHEDERCILYCTDCKELVCATCVSTTHQMHALKNAKLLIAEKMEFIEKNENRIDQIILPGLSRKQKRLEDLLTFHNQASEKAEGKICKWEEYLRENIIKVLKTQKDDLIQTLHKSSQTIKESILPEITKIKEFHLEVQNIRKDLEKSAETDNLENYEIKKTLEAKLSEVLTYEVNIRSQVPKFDQKQMGKMPLLGEILFKEIFQLKLVASFPTGFTCVNKIISEETGTLLLRSFDDCILKRIKIDDGNFTQLQKWKIETKDMASLQSGEIVFILPDKTEIRVLKIDQEQTPNDLTKIENSKLFYDPTPQCPTAIHVSRDNKVIVSTVEPGRDVIPMDEQCKAQIFVLDKNGDLISRFDYDKNMFCFPDKISSMNDSICISDSISDYSGRVVTLDNTGKVKWMYGDVNSSLIVSDIVHTPLGNIVLLQVCQGSLIVLDPNGVCLNSWNLSDLGISHPYSLSIDKNGHLLIGCGVNGINLHILEFMES